MVHITRGSIGRDIKERIQLFLRNNPTDDQQIEYFSEQLPNFEITEIFQIFEIFNNRRHAESEPNILDSDTESNTVTSVSNYSTETDSSIQTLTQLTSDSDSDTSIQTFTQHVNQNMAAPQRQEIFAVDPYNGNINPGNSEGAKLYMKATASMKEDDKFSINIDTSHKFLEAMTRDTNNFGWSSLVRNIQTGPNELKSLLRDHKNITMADMKRQAYKTWGNHSAAFADQVPDNFDMEDIDPAQNNNHRAPFFRRVRSRMIAKRIVGYLNTSDYEVLKNKAHLLTWSRAGQEEMDGPTILWILFQISNPSTRVGVAELKENLRSATSAKFQHNVKDLTDYMSKNYRDIIDKNQTHEDYILDLFTSLETVPNPDFKLYISEERRAWELGEDKDADTIIAEALTLYHNKMKRKLWDVKDPKDAKILALTTKINELVEQQSKVLALATAKHDTFSTSGDKKNANRTLSIAEWRKVKGAPMVQRDDKTWWWCPKHVLTGHYDGLYVTHKPEDHDEWQQRKDARNKARNNGGVAADTKPVSEEKKLALTDSLKAALLTRCDLTGAQVDALLNEARQEADF